jgi:hypothetical protein
MVEAKKTPNIRDKLLESKTIAEKKKEDNLLKGESLERKLENKLESWRDKIFREEDNVLFDEKSVRSRKKKRTDYSDPSVIVHGNKLISKNLPPDLVTTNLDLYYGYEFPLPEEIVAETLYRWYKAIRNWIRGQ